MTDIEYERVQVLVYNVRLELRKVRDLKVLAKSSTKARYTKLEKHLALCLQLAEEILVKNTEKSK